MEWVAKALGIPMTDSNGRRVLSPELQGAILTNIRGLILRSAERDTFKSKCDALRFFESGMLADCDITVTIGEGKIGGASCDDAALGDASTAAAGFEDANNANTIKVLRVHSVTLAMRSRYCETIFSQQWRETRERNVHISLECEQAYDDFCLLLKLSYGPSYTVDGDRALDKDVLLRLLVLADSFEFVDCIRECAEALKEGMTYHDALRSFEAIPESLAAHDFIRSLLTRAGDVAAVGLGPVHQLWTQGVAFDDSSEKPVWKDVLPLKPHVQLFPVAALESALRSEKLSVSCENECFMLVRSWADHQVHDHGLNEEHAQKLFERLIRSLRFHHMTLDFLANLVMTCPRMKRFPDALNLIGDALWSKGSMGRALRASCKDLLFGPRDRAPQSSANANANAPQKWALQGAFDLTACEQLGTNRSLVSVFGLANGYPVEVQLMRRLKNDQSDSPTLGLFIGLGLKSMLKDAGDASYAVARAVAFGVTVSVGNVSRSSAPGMFVADNRERFGYRDMLSMSFADALHDGSPFIQDGKLNVRVEVWYPPAD